MRHSLVLDIHSGSLAAGLAARSDEGHRVIGSARGHFSTHPDAAKKAMFANLHSTLSRVFHETRDMARGVEHAIVTLSSPWSRPPLSQMSALEESELSLSSADPRLIERIHDEIRKIFGVRSHVRFKSFLPLYFETHPEKFEDHMPRIVVRHGRGSSDAMLVSGRRIREIKPLEFGTDDEAQELANASGLSIQLARSMISLARQGSLLHSINKYVKEVLEQYEKKEREIFFTIAPGADVYVITDDPLSVLARYSTRLG